MHPLGMTRTSVQRNHAFIGTDGHVQAPLPGWTDTQGIILISPQMGAEFTEYFALMDVGGTAGAPLPGVQRFLYVLEGIITLSVDTEDEPTEDEPAVLEPGNYAYLPADTPHSIVSGGTSQLVLIEKRFIPLAGVGQPSVVIGHEQDVESFGFMGDPDAQLKLLLPDVPEFDMGVNLFRFQPGAALPFVETHIMEHGLLLTEGQGIYRLDDCWYPIRAGDVIWMGPYCPQWFTAIGKTPSAYLYYKNVNRDPLDGGHGVSGSITGGAMSGGMVFGGTVSAGNVISADKVEVRK
ncbi:MAG: (S)-ureidoglycine aminohydrolase [Chloroflexota bacterium]